MNALKAQVKNGRLVLDEPTTLPEGTVVALTPNIEEPTKQLSWDEIKALYPEEWVVMIDLLYTEPNDPNVAKQICGGVVFAHSKKRDGLLRSTNGALAGMSAAFFFTGKMKGHLLRWGK